MTVMRLSTDKLCGILLPQAFTAAGRNAVLDKPLIKRLVVLCIRCRLLFLAFYECRSDEKCLRCPNRTRYIPLFHNNRQNHSCNFV